jgi:hypothetical protein
MTDTLSTTISAAVAAATAVVMYSASAPNRGVYVHLYCALALAALALGPLLASGMIGVQSHVPLVVESLFLPPDVSFALRK